MFYILHGYNSHNTYMHSKHPNSDLEFEKKHLKATRDGVTYRCGAYEL